MFLYYHLIYDPWIDPPPILQFCLQFLFQIKPQRSLHFQHQSDKILVRHFHPLVLSCILRPCLNKYSLIILKSIQWIISVEIIDFVLIQNNQNKEIQHHILLYQNENNEENTIITLISFHCVKHHHVPIFSSGTPEKHEEGMMEIFKIIHIIYNITTSDVSEQEYSKY